jgi:hypothetical protein
MLRRRRLAAMAAFSTALADGNFCAELLAGIGVVPGAGAAHPDNIIFDITPNPNGGTGVSASGFRHPTCVNTPSNPAPLPAVQ